MNRCTRIQYLLKKSRSQLFILLDILEGGIRFRIDESVPVHVAQHEVDVRVLNEYVYRTRRRSFVRIIEHRHTFVYDVVVFVAQIHHAHHYV